MTGHDFDAMEEFAAEAIIIRHLSPGRTVRALAQRFPDAGGLAYAFALTCVAAGLEAEHRADRRTRFPPPAELYRVVALLTADILELSQAEDRLPTGADLLFHWMRTGDPMFA